MGCEKHDVAFELTVIAIKRFLFIEEILAIGRLYST